LEYSSTRGRRSPKHQHLRVRVPQRYSSASTWDPAPGLVRTKYLSTRLPFPKYGKGEGAPKKRPIRLALAVPQGQDAAALLRTQKGLRKQTGPLPPPSVWWFGVPPIAVLHSRRCISGLGPPAPPCFLRDPYYPSFSPELSAVTTP